ncbi:MAG: hypothetical protein M1834_000745 [Cirrosporium novae-zelandiae]|nr:MAG: hypothetical protein M1834_000745 [Cirrosporium novae-zelandiae]
MEYFNAALAKARKGRSRSKSPEPVLNDEDEAFLKRITSEETPPPLPTRPGTNIFDNEEAPNDAQLALMDGSQNIALPVSPNEQTPDIVKEDRQVEEPRNIPLPETPATELPLHEIEAKGKEGHEKKAAKEHKAKRPISWAWLRKDSRDHKKKLQEQAALDLMSAASSLKTSVSTENIPQTEVHKEEEDMVDILESLNLAAVNNRAFSVSAESREVLRRFTIVLKDLANGVPTAYDDLEKLLTDSDQQIQKMFGNLPDFLKKLIQSLPGKISSTLLGPELLAATAENPEVQTDPTKAQQAAAAAKKMGMKTPSLKDMVGKPSAIAGMLRTIVNALRARFPALMGMNVLWSLALCVLLLVFWYCHKRGRQVRLENEQIAVDAEVARLEAEWAALEAMSEKNGKVEPSSSLKQLEPDQQPSGSASKSES